MKVCSKCKIEKEFHFFSKSKDKKGGISSACKKCLNLSNKNSYYKHQQQRKITRDGKKNQKKEYDKQYHQQNKQEIQEYARNYTKEHRAEISAKEKQRFSSDASFRLLKIRRNRRRDILNDKYNSTKEDLGCTPEEWRDYLQAKFDENMTWDNYGSYWHVDEIIPCSAWDLSNPEHQKACFHYLNSQPLEAKANIRKGGANRKDYTADVNQFLMVLRALDII